MVDWDAGSYERTAAELAPVAEAVVELSRLSPDDDVLDLACGTGNATVLAAARGARVTGVDSALRLLGVARGRLDAAGLHAKLQAGDLLDIPLDDGSVDVVISVFGVIFAPDRSRALREIARVLRPGGRALLTAWVPAGPIHAMLAGRGEILGRVTSAPPSGRVAWADPDTLGPLAAEAGLVLQRTTAAELAISDTSPEAYVAAGAAHPVAVATEAVIACAGVAQEIRAAMIGALHDANEDPTALLIHSPYVVHELSNPVS